MDNVNIHHTREVTEYLEMQDIACMYLPVYSPMLNPAEHLFSKVKSIVVQRGNKNKTELTDSLCDAVGQVSVADCRGWLRKCKQYYPGCIHKDSIFVDVPQDDDNQVVNVDGLDYFF